MKILMMIWELLATTILLILCICRNLVNLLFYIVANDSTSYLSIIIIILGSAIGQTYLEAKMLDLKAKIKGFARF